MYYEPYPGKKRSRRRGCLNAAIGQMLKWLLTLIALAVLVAVGLYFLPTSLFMTEPNADLSLTDGLPSSPYNVLILGVDVSSGGSQRSDTMMVASIDGKTLRLTSIQRDMVVELEGHGKQKINAAYAFGGPELAMRAVNEALDLNIVRYVTVDFTAVVKMVDALGGIDLDISQEEMEHINRNVLLSRKVFEPQGYVAKELMVYGEDTHLDGLQALAYARIRKLDSDFVRTSRQRTVIATMLGKLRSRIWNPVMDAKFLTAGLGGIQTNLSPVELLSLGEKVLLSGEIRQLRLPLDGSFHDNGSTLTLTDRQANVDAFRAFVYGE